MSIRERAAAALRDPGPAEVRAAGTYVVYGAAVLASFSTLYELALNYAGWNTIPAFLFAAVLDIYWLTALHTAMDKAVDPRKRAAAAFHAFAAIAVSVACNILYHELHAGNWHLGKASGAVITALMASVPLLAAAALTHLRFLGRADRASQGGKARADRPKARTAPASHPAQPPQTVPATPEPSQPTAPDRPGPPQGEGATIPAAEGDDEALPRELKAGGRPDPLAVEMARKIYVAGLREGTIHNRRTLAAAVNARYGCTVIGETSASRVIDEYRSKRTA